MATDPYAGWLDEFYGAAELDPITGEPTSSTPDNPVTWGTPGAGWGSAGSTNWLDTLKGLFTGSTGGTLGQLAAFGGLATLLNKLAGSQSQQPVGYQGGIPKFTYERQQTPMAQQRPEGYRPGQGGISYFAPAAFKPAGYTPKSAEEFLTASAAPAAPAPNPESSGGAGLPNPDTSTIITNATGGGSGLPEGEGFPVNRGPSSSPIDVTTLAAAGGYMPGGGITMLAGGRYLRGPGDGVSDSIAAQFDHSGKPARLADGEFVIDARTVSEIGNGSSDAGARKLYAMMDRVHKARKTAKRGEASGADKYLPK